MAHYPPDVLPLWVAEMDARCPAVVEAVRRAVQRGDTGYRWGPATPRPCAVRREAWGWEIDTSAAMIVPDVMIGAAELLRLLTDEGGPVVVIAAGLRLVLRLRRRHRRRRVVEAPLHADGAPRPRRAARGVREAPRAAERAAYLLCNPHNPTGTVHAPRRAAPPSRRSPRSTACGWSPTRSTRRSCTPATAFTPYLTVPGGERGFACCRRRRGGTSPGSRRPCWWRAGRASTTSRRCDEVDRTARPTWG